MMIEKDSPQWFNGTMTVAAINGDADWHCPVNYCPGKMIFNGTSWPMVPVGYHHTCDRCGITYVIPREQYPRRRDARTR